MCTASPALGVQPLGGQNRRAAMSIAGVRAMMWFTICLTMLMMMLMMMVMVMTMMMLEAYVQWPRCSVM